jgi:hypothetical protein
MKNPVVLGMELAPLIEKLTTVLDAERDPVRQQKAIEMLAVRHASAFGPDTKDRVFIADSMHKHIVQILAQWETFRGKK